MLKHVLDEKLVGTNKTLHTVQQFATIAVAAAATANERMTDTVTEMKKNSMKKIQKHIEEIKKKIDTLEEELRSVRTTADQGCKSPENLKKCTRR